MPRFQWSALNNQQTGTYAEYFAKMELTMYGFEVYSTEIDDRGIDFIVRIDGGRFLQIQSKSLRNYGYVFMPKHKFKLPTNQQHRDDLWVALSLLFENKQPELFLIPASTWLKPDAVFVERNYEGLKSTPEWGINISKRNMPRLREFEFENMLEAIRHSAQQPNR